MAEGTISEQGLVARARMSEMRDKYSIDESYFRGMIIGDKGIGKTELLKTMVKPVFHDCWDNAGEQTLLEDVKGKAKLPDWLYPRTQFQRNTAQDFRDWVGAITEDAKAGIFNEVGTYVLDSLTTWGDGLQSVVLEDARNASEKHGENMELQDWGLFLQKATFYLKKLITLPCHVVILGHIQEDRDMVTGRIINNIMIPGQTSQRSPIWMSEMYYMLLSSDKKDAKGRPERFLLTGNDTKYKASTRLGRGGKFDLHEKPDIKYLLKKAGLPCGAADS